jgi:dipeptidyl aminopeptidase/acylaminoacyl peptidase
MRLPPSAFRLPRSASRLPSSVSFIFHLSSFIFFLTACVTTQSTPIPLSTASTLYVFRFAPPALLEYDSNFTIAREIPLNLPCPLTATHPAPSGRYIALELECTNGPLVQVVDIPTGEVSTPFTDVDSHFLAWDFEDGLYLRVDTLGNMRLMRVVPNGPAGQFPLTMPAYDMDFAPNDKTLTYSFTRGLGLGSELWAATHTGSHPRQLHADSDSIITFARWSPDGKQIAFIKLPDTATPFPLGELWVMDADGSRARPLAPADAGRGYAPAWSPDSTRIAFVGRDNPDDPAADQSAGALVSNIYLVETETGQRSEVTRFDGMLVESPVWSADGHFIAFSVVSLNDTINVWFADLVSGAVTLLESRGPACCPGWIRK